MNTICKETVEFLTFVHLLDVGVNVRFHLYLLGYIIRLILGYEVEAWDVQKTHQQLVSVLWVRIRVTHLREDRFSANLLISCNTLAWRSNVSGQVEVGGLHTRSTTECLGQGPAEGSLDSMVSQFWWSSERIDWHPGRVERRRLYCPWLPWEQLCEWSKYINMSTYLESFEQDYSQSNRLLECWDWHEAAGCLEGG